MLLKLNEFLKKAKQLWRDKNKKNLEKKRDNLNNFKWTNSPRENVNGKG